MLPGRPVRHQVGVGDQHPRRIGMGAEHADRLARLDEQGLIALEPRERRRRSDRSSPSRARPGRCRHRPPVPPAARRRRVEIVHQHPQRCFGQPALGRQRRAGGGADDAASCRGGSSVVIAVPSHGRVAAQGRAAQASVASRMRRSAACIGAANRASYGGGQVLGRPGRVAHADSRASASSICSACTPLRRIDRSAG